MKYIYLDLNHWIKLSSVHFKSKGTEEVKRIYNRLLEATQNEEVVIPLSLIHLLEISGARWDINARRKLIETILTFTRSNCIQPLPMTLEWEIRYATIKTLSENLYGYDKVRAQTHHDIVINVKNKYPYFPIDKGISALLGVFPSLTGIKSKEQYELIMSKVQEFLTEPANILNIAVSEYTRSIYNILKETDFQEIIKREEKLTAQRRLFGDKRRRKEIKFIQFLDTSGVNEIIVRYIIFWSSELGINYYEGIERTLNFKDESQYEENKQEIRRLIQNMPSAWCWFNLEYFRDRHYERILKTSDIFDIYSIANAIPYCDIVLCDNFFSTAVKSTGIGKDFNTKVSHKIEFLEKELKN